eukprot:PITA_01440
MEAISMFLTYACLRKIKVYQMYVKSAFLNGELEEEVYIEQPEGFLLFDKEDYIRRLKKALYGLKQAPRAWYARLDGYLHQQGFMKGSADNNLCVTVDQDNLTIVEDKGISIYQTKYIKEMLKKSKMEDCKPVLTPMVTGCKLSLEDSSKHVEQRLYRSMIGSLLYVTASRPDVMQAVGQVARIQATPKESHIIVVKRILRYLKGIAKYGLWYPKGNDLVIQAYTDADWAGSVDDRKSTSGAAFYLGGYLVSWLSKSNLQSRYP